MKPRRWRTTRLIVEAVRNVFGAAGRSILILLVMTSAFAIASGSEMLVLQRSVRTEAQLLEAGFDSIRIFGDGISVTSCESLASHPDVIVSGAVREAGEATFQKAPSSAFRYFELSGNLDRLLLASFNTESRRLGVPGVYVGRDVANELGLTAGSTTNISVGGSVETVVVAGVTSDLGKWDPARRWVLAPSDLFEFTNECWTILTADTARELGEFIDAGLLVVDPGEVTSQRGVPIGEFTEDPVTAVLTRPTRWSWLAGASLISAFYAVVLWTRRSEMAMYALVNTRKFERSLILLTEWTCLVLAAALIGFVAASSTIMVIDRSTSDSVLIMGIASSLLMAGVATLAVASLVVLSSRGSVIDQLRDR